MEQSASTLADGRFAAGMDDDEQSGVQDPALSRSVIALAGRGLRALSRVPQMQEGGGSRSGADGRLFFVPKRARA